MFDVMVSIKFKHFGLEIVCSITCMCTYSCVRVFPQMMFYPGLVLLLLLVQLGLVHTGTVQVEPQGLSDPGEQRGEQRGHVCHTGDNNNNNNKHCQSPVCRLECSYVMV